jgi:hypothetical protein
MSGTNKPSQVLIIRHGEKLGDSSSDTDGGPDLSIPGSSRAAAIPSLFLPGTPQMACALGANGKASFVAEYDSIVLDGQAPRFSTPDFLFATQASSQSNRPVETITPLSLALGLAIDDTHPDADYPKVASDILDNAKYADKVVLVCWHHGNIPGLAQKLGIPTPPAWSGSVFDRVWRITYLDDIGTLQDEPQSLLFGDSAS